MLVDEGAARIAVKPQAVNFNERNGFPVRLLGSEALISADVRNNPCNKLTRGKRLNDVIIRAEAEPLDFIKVLLLCADEQNGNILVLAHAAADFKPVKLGQHNIKQD